MRGWDPDLHRDLSGIPLAASSADAVHGAAVILSVNWTTVALDVAREARQADVIAAAGVRFADVAMMAPIPGLGVRVPMFIAD